MTPNQVRNLMIERANKLTGTKGERQFEDYQQSRVMGLLSDKSLSFYDQLSQKYFSFQLDFVRLRYPTLNMNLSYVGTFDVDFEIDGKGHKEKWDSWKDGLKAEADIKVIHIPDAVTKEEYWPYLDKQLTRALAHKEMVHYIAA